jgi:hypothetical protein
MDRKLRTANKLLQNASKRQELPHDEKLNKLKAKFEEGEFATKIKLANIPHINASEVISALGRASKQAATAIDGWTASLLSQTIQHQPSIADAIGEMMTYFLTQPLSEDMRRCLVAGRLVAVPKGDVDVRPIVISSLLVNLAGSIAVSRDDRMPCEAQFAVSVKQGCQRILHKIRRQSQEGKTIVRIDLKNAFGSLKRSFVEQFAKTAETTLAQYFRLVYGSPSDLIVFGPDSHDTVRLGEGVKQGDATSSYFFCHTIDAVLRTISSRTDIPLSQIYSYMDDLTFATKAEEVDRLVAVVVEEFAKVGMSVNLEKSSALSDDTRIYSLPRTPTHQPFTLLGIDLSTSPREWVQKKNEQHSAYFDLVRSAGLHPQIQFVLLRVCGTPRLTYHVSVVPPDVSELLTVPFERRLLTEFSSIIDPTGNTVIAPEAFHSKFGIGAPMLTHLRAEIYEATRRMALEDDPNVPLLTLLNVTPSTQHAAHQSDAQWLFFDSPNCALTPSQFSTALAIRLNIIPPHLDISTQRCACGEHLTYNHILSCDQATGLSHATRHNKIRDTIIQHARRFAITCSAEPAIYSYADGKKHRPDILFNVGTVGIATDVTVVQCQAEPGTASEQADKEKEKIHTNATSTIGHQFIPCALESHGYFGNGFVKLTRRLSEFIPSILRSNFVKEVTHAVSTVMAANRAESVLSAVHRQRWT